MSGINGNAQKQKLWYRSRIHAVVAVAVLTVIVAFAITLPVVPGRTDPVIRWTGISVIVVTIVALVVQRERWRQKVLLKDHLALHDSLTGLTNYASVAQWIELILQASTPLGLLYCDVDRLDAVNSSLGRGAGDLLLQQIASRIGDALPQGYRLARCGGDEFAVVCVGTSEVVLTAIAEQIVAAFQHPFDVGGHEHAVSITIGIVSRGAHHQHSDQLLRDGHRAMLGAKVGGRGGIARLESTSDHPWTVDDLRLEDDLRNAMQSGRGLFPVFQPIVRLSDRKVVGYEALVRWQHPERGLLMPGEFIGLAEKTGLIVPLGWWMLDTVCSVFAAEKLDGWVSINVAGAQLGKGELVPTVARALEVSGLRPWQLHLEITESQLVNPTPQLLDELAMLHALGVALALDDFGTGYSSVALLRDLNIHTIKIDFSFTSYIDTQPRIARIVKGLIAFCQQLGILVIAEGVEMPAQDELLRAFNCQFGQGFLYGHPDSLQRSGAPKDVTGSMVSPKSM